MDFRHNSEQFYFLLPQLLFGRTANVLICRNYMQPTFARASGNCLEKDNLIYQIRDNTTFQVDKWVGNRRAQHPTAQHLAVKTQAYADFFYSHIKDPILSLVR